MTPDDVKGTHLEDPKRLAAWAGMYTDAGPAFYLEHLKRLIKNGIQPYFPLAHVHQLEIVERLLRKGVDMGPLNLAVGTYGGGGTGHNPFDWMEFIRRTPQGAVLSFWSGMRVTAVAQPLAIIMGQHVRVGNEDNLWNSKRERITTVRGHRVVVRRLRRRRPAVAPGRDVDAPLDPSRSRVLLDVMAAETVAILIDMVRKPGA